MARATARREGYVPNGQVTRIRKALAFVRREAFSVALTTAEWSRSDT